MIYHSIKNKPKYDGIYIVRSERTETYVDGHGGQKIKKTTITYEIREFMQTPYPMESASFRNGFFIMDNDYSGKMTHWAEVPKLYANEPPAILELL